MSDFILYVIDTETTGLNPYKNDVVEVSLIRLPDEEQLTCYMQPTSFENVEEEALRINGHKLEDLKHLTDHGKKTYKDPKKVIVEVENWVLNDGASSDDRIIVGQNPSFDANMLQQLWIKCGSLETYPFGRHTLDTKQLALVMDLCKGERRQRYNLISLISDFGIKKEKAHKADADCRMTKDLWLKEFNIIKKLFNA